MTRTFVRLRHSPMARFLALLAMVAQLGLVVPSTAHRALMLAQGGGDAVEVCTARGIERVSLPAGNDVGTGELPAPGVPLTDCAVCAASGLLAGLAASPSCLPAPHVAAAAGPAAKAAPIPSRTRELPPTRGPPAVS